jgi:hypothetical protein
MSILANIKSMLADSVDGSVSSKRVVTVLAFILCAVGFIANLFWRFQVDEFIYNSMMYIVIGGLGFTGLEKFAPKSKGD